MDKMTEYERKRQENIERNEQMLARLRVHSAAQDLRSASKKPNCRVSRKTKMDKMTEYERKRQENIERNEQMLARLRVHSAAQDLRSASKKPNYRVSRKTKMDKMTEYERKRQENIERNEQMLALLRVRSAAQDLRSASKNPKSQTKRLKTPKREREPVPTILRTSMRTRGISPEILKGSEYKRYSAEAWQNSFNVTFPDPPISKVAPLSFAETYVEHQDDVPYTLYLDQLKGLRNVAPSVDLKYHMPEFKLEDLKLESKNIFKTTPTRISCLEFLPCRERVIVVSGGNEGHLSLWDAHCNAEEGDYNGLHIYRPHASQITGIAVKPFSITKVISCSYDGFIRSMDIEKEVFDMVYNSVDKLSAICTSIFSYQSLYFAEGHGEMKMLDWRVGSVPNSFSLHEKRINSIDFNPQKPYLVSTSSDDGTARIFDLRKMKNSENESLVTAQHRKAVYCAYFSPSGNYLATTSYDNSVGLWSGLDSENVAVIYQYNPLRSFRVTWGWDDKYLFFGNKDRGLEAYCTVTNETTTLYSPLTSAVPTRLAKHPFCCGMLVGGGRGGKVHIWQNSQELLDNDLDVRKYTSETCKMI